MSLENPRQKLKILIVEDSLTAQKLLVNILEKDPDLSVIGVASSGEEALKMLKSLNPDVITMDIHMPGMNGLDVTRKIMETTPIPIIVVSASCLVDDVQRAFQLIEAGALTAIPKPIMTTAPDFETLASRLKQTVKDMSQVKVVRRWTKDRMEKIAPQAISSTSLTRLPGHHELDLIVIGASTGGPAAVANILKDLPANYPLPLVLVQHIAPGFLAGMVEWLSGSLKLKVKIAEDGETLKAGTLYLPQEGKHLTVNPRKVLKISQGEPVRGHRPAVSNLFKSAADNYASRALGILLTGMGKDGASELTLMKTGGATTICQDKESSVVHGMPGAAIGLGGASHVLSLDAIATVLAHIGQRP